MARHFASGDWTLGVGNEETFVTRWTEFLDWTKETAPGFRWATLIRDEDDPTHVISLAEWDSQEAMAAWRALPGFGPHLMACRTLCRDMRGSSYVSVALVEGAKAPA